MPQEEESDRLLYVRFPKSASALTLVSLPCLKGVSVDVLDSITGCVVDTNVSVLVTVDPKELVEEDSIVVL